MFPNNAEFVVYEQYKARLAEAEKIRLAKTFQQEKSLINIKQPVVRKVLSVLLNLI